MPVLVLVAVGATVLVLMAVGTTVSVAVGCVPHGPKLGDFVVVPFMSMLCKNGYASYGRPYKGVTPEFGHRASHVCRG